MPEKLAHQSDRSFAIGPVPIRNRVFLAPMSGVTDVPFRKLAWRYGAGMVVSEMVASEAFIEGEAEMQLKVQSAGLPIHMVQIAGREAIWMARAAKVAEETGAHIIDINMGCPAKRVTTGYSGSALMRDLDHANRLIDAVVEAVSIPVTLKMRLGWDENTINAPELAERAENSGVQMITVHGRTRNQFYKGRADWKRVAEVRDATCLPVVINGDITSSADAVAAMQASAADAVMIGRAAYGAPWLPGLVAGSLTEVQKGQLIQDVEVVIGHHEEMLDFYGLDAGIRQARKHIGWYMDKVTDSPTTQLAALRRTALTSFDVNAIHSALRAFWAEAMAMNRKAA